MSAIVVICQYFNSKRFGLSSYRVTTGYQVSGFRPDNHDAFSHGFFPMVRKLTSRRCQVCGHDERWGIELRGAGGASLDSLAGKLGVDGDAIWRPGHDHVTAEAKANYLCGPAELSTLAEKAALEGDSV